MESHRLACAGTSSGTWSSWTTHAVVGDEGHQVILGVVKVMLLLHPLLTERVVFKAATLSFHPSGT